LLGPFDTGGNSRDIFNWPQAIWFPDPDCHSAGGFPFRLSVNICLHVDIPCIACRPSYLVDASTVVDFATVVTLSPGQRRVLGELLGLLPSTDAQTAATRIVRMYGGAPQAIQLPPSPSPWRDLFAAANNAQLPIADAMVEAEIVARLTATPFMAAPALHYRDDS